jgi:hypothetical protein
MARGVAGSYGARTENNPARQPTKNDGGVGGGAPSEYHEIGNTGRFTNPEGTFTVGVRQNTTATSPPLSEQSGRGIFAVNPATRFFQENQPTHFEPGFGGPVMADIVNDRQFTPS